EFYFDYYKVKKVCGVAGDKSNVSIKNTEVSLRPSTKIIQGDWIWHANRDVNNPRHIWHNYKGKNRMVMLFGDTHAEFYQFLLTILLLHLVYSATTLTARLCCARLRWVSSRIFLRRRRFFGVASTYSSEPMYSSARSRLSLSGGLS